MTDTVEVIDAPPLLQVDSTQLGTLIDAKTATALPLATRDINQLTLLRAGGGEPEYLRVRISADDVRDGAAVCERGA